MNGQLDDLELPEGLEPSRRSRVTELVAILLGSTLVMFVFAAAAASWPGSTTAWTVLGLVVCYGALYRAWGPPWGGEGS